MGIFKKIGQALKKTKESFSSKIDSIFTKSELDDDFWFDFLRSLKEKDFIVTETMVNYNGSECSACEYRPKGTCYVNTMMPFIKGANMNMYWHFREHYCGHEIAHGAVYTTAGRLTYNADEIMKTYDALDKIKDVLFAERQKSDIALHFSTTSFLTFKYEKMFDSNNYIWNTMNNYHTALRHYNTDVIDTESDLSKYKVVISPLLCNCTEYNFKERVIKFINDGGTWIVGPMSDIFTDFGARFIDKPHSFLEELGGVYLDKVIPFETEEIKAKYVENKEYIKACAPYYSYKPLDGSKSIVEYENDYLNGSSMIIERKVGKGKIIVVGAQIGKDVLLNLVGLKPILEASSNIELVKRNGIIYCVEMENEIGKVQLDKEYEDLLTGKKYKGEVVVDKHNILALKECK